MPQPANRPRPRLRQRLVLPLALSAVCTCVALFTGVAGAADTELLDVLLRNGVISPAQHGSLSRKEGESARDELLEILRRNGAITRKQYADLTSRPGAVASAPPRAATPPGAPPKGELAAATPPKAGGTHAASEPAKVETKGRLEWTSADGNFTWRFGGRLHLDATFYDNEGGSDEQNGVDVRRARVEFQGTLYKHWMWKLDYEFAQIFEIRQGFRDAYIRYLFKDQIPDHPTMITVGQFKEYFGLESLNSSNHQPFVERALVSRVFHDFAESIDGRRIGLGAQTAGNDFWTAALGVFGKNTAGDSYDEYGDPLAIEGRTTISPIHTADRVVHVGAAVNWIDVFAPDQVRFGQRPEARIGAQRFVDTGAIEGSDSVMRYGLELGGIYGPLWLQGEFLGADVNRVDQSQLWFQGWHVDAGWVLTGEPRGYDWINGVFLNPKPAHNFNPGAGGWGALEWAARYSVLDLNDQNVDGGKETNVTTGLHWFLNQNFAFKFDYTKVIDVEGGEFEGVNPNEFLMRAQAFW